VLAVALALLSAGRAHEEARQASERLAAVRDEVNTSTSRLRTLMAASGASLERRTRAEAARDGSPTRIVADIAAVLPRDARLERLSIEYGRDVSLQMQVVAKDASAWDRLLARLEAARQFQGVEPGPEDREGEVRSVVKARWVGGEVQ
jgi:hypothetical protein